MNDFLSGLLLGLAYAAPIGPQNSFLIASATHLNARRSALAAAAVALNDIALAAICFWGIGGALSAAPSVKVALLAAGALWLARLGIGSLRSATPTSPGSQAVKSSIAALVASAFVLTWGNPQALLDGTIILGSAATAAHQRTYVFLGIAAGSIMWFGGLTIILTWMRRTTPRAMRYLHVLAGLVMLGFAGKMAVQAANEAIGQAHAAPRARLKVAILDNLKSEKLASERYVFDYLNGIELGKDEARAQGIDLETREFFFGKKGLEILAQVKEVKAWAPDVVIAPRASDLLLMLRNEFPETAVISPLATAEAVTKLSANFHSMTPPNSAVIKVFARYVKETFPGRGLYQIVQADCVNCIDFANQFASAAKAGGIELRNEVPSVFVTSSVETVELAALLAGYQPGDLIVLPNLSYTSGVIMARIADHLKRNDLVFIGGDGWGDWNVGYAGKFKVPYDYTGYRMVPWSIRKTDADTTQFIEHYRKRFGEEPHSNISQITNATVAAITSMAKSAKTIDRAGLLNALAVAKEKNPEIGRPASFALFKVTQSGEEFVGVFEREERIKP